MKKIVFIISFLLAFAPSLSYSQDIDFFVQIYDLSPVDYDRVLIDHYGFSKMETSNPNLSMYVLANIGADQMVSISFLPNDDYTIVQFGIVSKDFPVRKFKNKLVENGFIYRGKKWKRGLLAYTKGDLCFSIMEKPETDGTYEIYLIPADGLDK